MAALSFEECAKLGREVARESTSTVVGCAAPPLMTELRPRSWAVSPSDPGRWELGQEVLVRDGDGPA